MTNVHVLLHSHEVIHVLLHSHACNATIRINFLSLDAFIRGFHDYMYMYETTCTRISCYILYSSRWARNFSNTVYAAVQPAYNFLFLLYRVFQKSRNSKK